jgi:hypothetical protein
MQVVGCPWSVADVFYKLRNLPRLEAQRTFSTASSSAYGSESRAYRLASGSWSEPTARREGGPDVRYCQKISRMKFPLPANRPVSGRCRLIRVRDPVQEPALYTAL